MRRISDYLMTFFMAVVVTACGGGGGSPGTSSGATTVTTTPAALFTTAPSSITLTSGTSASYQVSGGVAPYSVASDTISLVSAAISNSTLSITAIKVGTASVLVTDSIGKTVPISVKVSLPGALFTTVPPSGVTLPSGGSAVTYGVGGGVGQLVATSNNAAVVTASINQQASVLTLQPLAAGSALVEVRDGSESIWLNVTVSPPGSLYTTAPSKFTTAVGVSSGYAISGGVAPYVATSSNAAVVQTSANGTSLTISGLAVGVAKVVIADLKGSPPQEIEVTVTAPAPGDLFTTAPSPLTVAVSNNAVTYSISGGVPPYLAVSSNVSVLTAGTSGNAGQFLDLKAVASGFAKVTISDSKNKVVFVDVTTTSTLFTTAPSALTVAVGATPEYLISGGLPFSGAAPYTATSSNVAVATASVAANGKLTINGVAGGVANIVIADSTGKLPLTIDVTVPVPTPVALFTTAPSSLTLLAGSTSDLFAISGGTPYADGYRAVSANGAIASVALNTSKTAFTITGVGGGATSIELTDSKGTPIVRINVTVNTPTPLLASSAAVTIQAGNSTVITLSGGVPAASGYNASSNNTGIAVVQVSNGNNLTIAGVSAGLATVTVTDSKNNSFSLLVTVPTTGDFYTTAPRKITLAVGQSQSYLLAAGTQPYQSIATSTDTRVATASVSGGALTVKAVSAGSAFIYAFDAAGKPVEIEVTVGAGAGANFYPTLSGGLSSTDGKIASSGYTTLTVTMKDPSGKGIPNQPIDVASDPKLTFPDGNTALTNSSGVATFRIKRASLLVSGAGALAVSYAYKSGSIATYPDGSTPPAAGQVVSTYMGYQLTTANVALNMQAPTTPMAAYGTQQITVNVTVDGLTSDTPVLVNFSATCGQVTPASVSTNSLGVVTTTYSATDLPDVPKSQRSRGCGGKAVEITASTVGADATVKTVLVTAAPATNMKFLSATPNRIYLKDSGGLTQSLVLFELVNAQDESIQAQDVTLSLKTLDGSAVNNVKASFYELGNVANKTLTTDSEGRVSVPVFSGTVPVSVLVNAKLVSDAKVNSDSAVLVIASGRPAQARSSISIAALSIEGWNTDGTTTNVTLSLADRQGNPVPDGTGVNFTTSGGVMVPPACNTGVWTNPATGAVTGFVGNSQCTVSIRSSNPRLTNSTDPKSRWAGRVAILAYAAGEEDFVDNNKNNIFDSGDTFTDLGNAYRDADETGSFTPGEFSVPRATSTCSSTGVLPPSSVLLGVPNTCDGMWGAADVRQQGIVIFATGATDITAASQISSSGLAYRVADMNGNSPPTESKIAVTAVDGTATNNVSCTVVAGGTAAVGNTLNASVFGATLSGCEDGDSVNVTVTSKLGVVSSRTFSIPSVRFKTVDVPIPSSQSFAVSGTAPFAAASSDPTVATVSVSGNVVTVTSVGKGTAAISVADSRSPEPQRVEVYSVKVE